MFEYVLIERCGLRIATLWNLWIRRRWKMKLLWSVQGKGRVVAPKARRNSTVPSLEPRGTYYATALPPIA